MPQFKKSLDFKFLKTIHTLFKKKNWDNALELLKEKLESDIFWDDKSIIYLYLTIAYAFYLKEDYHRSKRYLQDNLLEEFPSNGEGLLFAAFFFLLEDKKPQAIALYTQILNNPNYHKKSQKILNKLKESSNENLAINNPSFFYQHQFFLDKKWDYSFFFWGIILLSLGVGIYYGVEKNWFITGLEKIQKTFTERNLEEENIPSPFNYYFKEMKKAIADKDINQAIILYNQALNLSPNVAIQEKFRILKNFIANPEIELITLGIPFAALKENPLFYQGIFLQITGKLQSKKGSQYTFRSKQYPQYRFIITFSKDQKIVKKNTYQVFFQFENLEKNQLSGKGIGLRYINNKVQP